MIVWVWIDAQLSPALAPWITQHFNIEAYSVQHLGLRDAKDRDIFLAAKKTGIVVMTKDSDFIQLLEQRGPPPQIIWIALGNTSNIRIKGVLQKTLLAALEILKTGEALVEISEPHDHSKI